MMTPQQKDLILDALRIGISDMPAMSYVVKQRPYIELIRDAAKIRAAIKELESMPTTEEV